MYTNMRLNAVLVAICLSGAPVSLMAADAKNADAKAAEAQTMIAAAEEGGLGRQRMARYRRLYQAGAGGTKGR